VSADAAEYLRFLTLNFGRPDTLASYNQVTHLRKSWRMKSLFLPVSGEAAVPALVRLPGTGFSIALSTRPLVQNARLAHRGELEDAGLLRACNL